jgi:hypothetical protein
MIFKHLRNSSWPVALNLILWLFALVTILNEDVNASARWVVVAGFVFAAAWQHHAYQRRWTRHRSFRLSSSSREAPAKGDPR